VINISKHTKKNKTKPTYPSFIFNINILLYLCHIYLLSLFFYGVFKRYVPGKYVFSYLHTSLCTREEKRAFFCKHHAINTYSKIYNFFILSNISSTFKLLWSAFLTFHRQ
jgi:hypothetical protein